MNVRLVLCDFARTITRGDVLDRISALKGNRGISRQIDREYRSGNIDGIEALQKRFELIKGLSIEEIEKEVLSKIRLKKGARKFFNYTVKAGIRTVVLSGNMNFVLRYFQNKLKFTEFYGSSVRTDNGRVGAFEPSADNKNKVAERLVSEGGYSENEIVAIGDSVADMGFLRLAKYRFLMRSKPCNADAILVDSFDDVIKYIEHI